MGLLARGALLWSLVVLLESGCPPDVLLVYRMVLHTEWSEKNFPKHYPDFRPPPQWSIVLGRSHNANASLFRAGRRATSALRAFAEGGAADAFLRGGRWGVLAEFFAPPLAQGVGTRRAHFFVDASHSKVSFICKIDPSPDWFIGVDSVDLCKGGKFLESVTFNLWPLDAGTDSGYTFTAPNYATDPPQKIRPIQEAFHEHKAHSFFYSDQEKLSRIAVVTFRKVKEFRLTQVLAENLVIASDVENATGNSTHIERKPMDESMNEIPKFPFNEDARKRKENKREERRRNRKRPELISAHRSKEEQTTTSSRARDRKVRRHLDCRVGEWSEWGRCSRDCDFGTQNRSRPVLSMGQRPCPLLIESRWCKGRHCNATANAYFRW